MIAAAEKRLLWHPRHDNRFVVGGGSQITLYECASEFPEIRHVTSQHDMQYMKCFAWSPDPLFEDLMAVGFGSGRVDLIRLEASKNAYRSNVLSGGPSAQLPVRNSRSCNALAFCTADPNYLAVGLDKVKGDASLMIWDIATEKPALSLTPLSSAGVHDPTSTSSRPQPPIARGDLGPRTDRRVLQQHAQTEIVSALAFLPNSTHILLAGISHRWLRLFDLRSSAAVTTNVPSKVQGIASDPFDPHRFACFGDGTITVWDARKLPHPLLSFTERDASADGASLRPSSSYTTIEFSSTRRGTLASLEREASYVRFWDVTGAYPIASADHTDGDKRDEARSSRKSWANLPWAAGSPLVLADTRRTKSFSRPLASFSLVPCPQRHPLSSHVMVVNKEGDLELYAIHDTPKQASWSSRGDLIIGAGESLKIIEGFQEEEPPAREPWEVPALAPAPNQGGSARHSQSRSRSRQREESVRRGRSGGDPVIPPPPILFGRGDEDGFPALLAPATADAPAQKENPSTPGKYRFEYTESSMISLGGGAGDTFSKKKGAKRRSSGSRAGNSKRGVVNTIVEDDISMVMRRRTLRGYGIGRPQHNSGILTIFTDSQELLCSPTPRVHGFDFTFEGLLGIWDGFPPLSNDTNTTPMNIYSDLLEPPGYQSHQRHSSQRSLSPADEMHGNFSAAVATLASRKGGEKAVWRPTILTSKPNQRQVALQLCGWSLKEGEFADVVKRWEKDGRQSRAACWLVFTRQYTKAVDLLMRSDGELTHFIIRSLIPHGPNATKSSDLRDHCERLIVRLQDPYFRAMLTHMALGDWSEVLEEESLPFRERLAIAFQFLDDKTVSSYLRRMLERTTASGNIDGIIVTGLTKPGMDILQNYVDRTGDVQTAAVLASSVCPSRFTDRRAGRWIEAYRDLLDGFKLHHHRVSFDIERGQVLHDAVQSGDLPHDYEWVPRQIQIRCNYCNKPVNTPNALAKQKGRVSYGVPYCGRALPRCSICLMTLSIVQDSPREAELMNSQDKDTIDDAIVICQTCRHGGHASHLLDWFFGKDGSRSHGVCAVADCDCRCADEF
ncbi:hypothetical protein BD779DRAFT_1609907 [Infundibulicybe gibba]|nr:hypothetical protein BD779DRAFT_1609907 [Infundibulicybe gibba]